VWANQRVVTEKYLKLVLIHVWYEHVL